MLVGLAPGAGAELARAAAAVPDSAAAAPATRDSSAGALPGRPVPGAAAVDSAAHGLLLRRGSRVLPDTARARIHQGRFDAPRWVMLRSLALPGWGQFHNGSWIKGVLLGGLDAYLRVKAVDTEQWILRHEGPVRDALHDVTTAQDSMSQYTVFPDPDDQITQKIQYWGPIYAAANDRYGQLVGPYNERLDRQISDAWLLGGLLVYSLMDAYVDAHFKNFKVEFEHDHLLPGGLPPAGQTRLLVRWDF